MRRDSTTWINKALKVLEGKDLEEKTFFEAYRDGRGELHVLARYQSSSMTRAAEIESMVPIKPTSDVKRGSVREFVWTGDATLAFAQWIGPRGLAKYEWAIEEQLR